MTPRVLRGQPNGTATMRTQLARMGTRAQFLTISLESVPMSRALTILVASYRRMMPCWRIPLKLTLWCRILGVTRTACFLMPATRASMRSLWVTILCPMVPLRVESMSVTFRGRLTGVRLKPRGLSLPFSRSALFMAIPIQRLSETLLNANVSGFLTVSTTIPMLVL